MFLQEKERVLPYLPWKDHGDGESDRLKFKSHPHLLPAKGLWAIDNISEPLFPLL